VTFDQIEYFMSCASCLNFSLAAKYHYVSVSTLSRNISALEEELGVKLFQRGYHGHTLTTEGVRFFDFAEAASRELDDFWLFVNKGRDKQGGSELLRIACYPFDNMFGEIVDCFGSLPPDYLGKKYKIKFVVPGSMIDSIKSGTAHMGIAARADLDDYSEEFSMIPFFSSSFSIRLKESDNGPLEQMEEIDLDTLFSLGLKYSDFLPEAYLDKGEGDKRIESEKDISRIGWISQKYAPELIWNRQLDMKDRYYLLPRTLEIPFLTRRSLPICGSGVNMEFVLFQKKSGSALPQQKLEQLRDYLARNMKHY